MSHEDEYKETKRQALSLLEKAMIEDPDNWEYKFENLYYNKGGMAVFQIKRNRYADDRDVHKSAYEYYAGSHFLGSAVDTGYAETLESMPKLQRLYVDLATKLQNKKKRDVFEQRNAELKGILYALTMDI